jgi:hypothetical protein
MKKAHKKPADAEMQPEYDFAQGVRGKYARRYAAGSNVVVLDPDVASAFPDSESANKALRSVMQSMHDTKRKKTRTIRSR